MTYKFSHPKVWCGYVVTNFWVWVIMHHWCNTKICSKITLSLFKKRQPMSKAFKKESDEDDEVEKPEDSTPLHKNYVTPFGLAQLQNELRYLLKDERPKIVETVRWAAGNGDRSENGDYIYGKRRLREIDRRVRYLTKRIESAEVVDPKLQQNLQQVFFGATVTYVQEDNIEVTVKIVGIDEADLEKGKISWISPVAKALMKSRVDDNVVIHTPAGKQTVEILDIKYELK
jgi:transcription elongation factor GreB